MPKATWTEVDLSHYVDTIIKGVSCVMGPTEKGPIAKPQRIGSAEQFERIYGRAVKGFDFALVVNRALAYGAVLWVSRVAHYTNAANAATLTAVKASGFLKDATPETPLNTLGVKASSEGVWGNKIKVKVVPSGLDSTNLFSLRVFEGETLVESFDDLSMEEGAENYAANIKSSSIELTDTGTGNNPAPDFEVALSGGNDGLAGLADADYIGSKAANTGFYAFGEVDDALQLATPDVVSPAVIAAGLAYCESRGDMVYIAETPFDTEPQSAVDFRLGRGTYSHAAFNSSYGAMYFGKPKVYDITQRKERYVSAVGDVLGVIAFSDWSSNESRVPAGVRRGKLRNCLGVDVNVGTAARAADGDYLCENQLNPLCSFTDTGPVVWAAQTLQREASLLREMNVRRMTIVMKKACTAYARAYIHQPNDPIEWRLFWLGLEPKFREWKAKRWIYDYRIECDQNAKSLEDAKINLPESVQRGEFHVKVFYKPMVGMKWILIQGIITRLDAKYDDSVVELAAV
jgi:phage tail sheath protein FI